MWRANTELLNPAQRWRRAVFRQIQKLPIWSTLAISMCLITTAGLSQDFLRSSPPPCSFDKPLKVLIYDRGRPAETVKLGGHSRFGQALEKIITQSGRRWRRDFASSAPGIRVHGDGWSATLQSKLLVVDGTTRRGRSVSVSTRLSEVDFKDLQTLIHADGSRE